MKKTVLNISLILLLASTGSVFAQQGFGTNKPDKSAAVDIVAPNKGLLIPRVALVTDNSAAPITNPANSLMVYNTTFNAAGNLKAGFYFWNGAKWEPFTTGSTDLNTTNTSLAVVNGELILTDSDGAMVKVPVSDINTDDQKIETFAIDASNVLTLTLEDGGTKTVSLAPYFNSTKLIGGTNTTVTGNGLVGSEYQVNVATATASNLGVVQIGSGINVTNGVISVPPPPAPPVETVTTITNTVAGHKVADYKNEAGTTVAINETVTNLTQNASGITYTKEDATQASAKVVSADAGNLITTGTDFGALLKKENVQGNQVKYEVINGLNTTAVLDGTSTADLQKYKVNVTFPTAPDGSETKISQGPNVTITGNGTTATPYQISSTNTDNQNLTYTTATKKLSIERGNEVDLSSLDTNSKSVVTAANTNVVVTPTPTPATDTITYAVDVKNAMPKFFYMPSIIIDTSVVDVNVVKTVNLYTQYTGQFNVTNTAFRSTSAPAQIPILPAATDLHYYVTYHDAASIEITGITDQGVMSYKVLGNTNSLSFVNIVFVIK